MAGAATFRVKGVVVDSISGEPVPFAAIFLHGTDRGMIANEAGEFDVTASSRPAYIGVSSMGYRAAKLPAPERSTTDMVISLVPEGVRLDEVTIRPGKEKYSKKNNPAVELMNKIRERSALTDPRRRPDYSYNKYERITIGLNDFNPGDQTEGSGGGWMLRTFPFLTEYIDTNIISGVPILNLAVREKASTVYNRANPQSTKEVTAGLRQTGLDDMLDPESLRLFYEDVMREVDVYGNDITILQNRFVSPLSAIADDFYKFYLTDTVDIGGERCTVLTFVPHNDQSFGFTGRFYVVQGDSTMFIKRIILNVPRNINLNFIDRVYITQDYERAPDGSRLKQRDDMIVEASLVPGTQGMYARRGTVYSNHSFEPPTSPEIFDDMRREIIATDAASRDNHFWASQSPDNRDDYNRLNDMMARLRRVPVFYWTEKVIKVLVSGYLSTGKNSKWDFGPMNTTISGNSVEGVRLRAGGITTANLSKRFFTRGYVAYGTRDRKWKYSAEVEYSFRDKKYHSREFPVHSLRATHLYDIDMIGQHYLFTNPDNMFLSIKRSSDFLATYHRLSKLEYTLELENNFSVVAGLSSDRQVSTPWAPFVDGTGTAFGHYTTSGLTVTLRYAPGEKFYQSKTTRYPINMDAPVFTLRHFYAPGGVAGNLFTLNKTELNITKRFWFSAFGYLDAALNAGHIWSRAMYPDLLIPNANLSYTIQPQSFALMNPMEFINDTYGAIDLTYWANGAILNYIPGVRRLKLREAFSFRGVWGSLSDRNNPALDPTMFRFPEMARAIPMGNAPYMEAAVGLDNIFRILRVDYVWRLTYRNVTGRDRRGVRIALHFTF
ncbi:MAG: carboxypeptidase-like regulatory domain-containing protein [Muribaculaceae bacterium]|nr:carboxypeptidase-like regulatory domain-containing protein [Muribaculaceae bacterium]